MDMDRWNLSSVNKWHRTVNEMLLVYAGSVKDLISQKYTSKISKADTA